MSKETVLKLLTVVVVGVGIQLLLILLGTETSKESPKHATVEFAQDYFHRNPQMSKWICKAYLTQETRSQIEQYIHHSANEAEARGFAPYATASMLYHIKTDTRHVGDNEATVQITGKIKTDINPVFFIVGLIFNIGETHQIDDTLQLKKENDHWKVCENFSTIFQDTWSGKTVNP